MGFECDEVLLLLKSVQSLLALREDINHPIQSFHKSFPDFITDPARCTDLRFYISPSYHTELAIHCLELMGKSLKRNICSVPDYALNPEVADLQERIKESGIRGGLEYACRSWHTHLQAKTDQIANLIPALRDFLEEKFLFWLEVLSVLGVVGDAARALNATMEWLDEGQVQVSIDVDRLLDTSRDFLRFVTEFFEVISQSGTHIYHSAMQLAPRSSIVRKLYNKHLHSPKSKIVAGVPDSWDSCTASVWAISGVDYACWSPCGRFVAFALKHATLEVRDSNTLELESVLQPPSGCFDGYPRFLAFSPDGRLLACYHYSPGSIVVWDIKTGAIVKDIEIDAGPVTRIVFSGCYTVTLFTYYSSFFRTYDALDGTLVCKGEILPRFARLLKAHWEDGGSHRFATSYLADGKYAIDIHQLQPSSIPPFPTIESFIVPPYDGEISFSPVFFHASFVTKTEVTILDVRDSKILLRAEVPGGPRSTCFSSDGGFFACGMEGSEIRVWKNTSAGYTTWTSLKPRLPYEFFSLSPTGISILAWGKGGVQLLDNHTHIPSSNKTTPNHNHGNHLVAGSRDGTRIATALRGDGVVTVFGPLSDGPERSINTGMRILDVQIVGNTVFTTDLRELVGWDLDVGEIVHRAPCMAVCIDPHPDEYSTLHTGRSLVAFTFHETIFLYSFINRSVLKKCRMDRDAVDIRSAPDGRQLCFIPLVEARWPRSCMAEEFVWLRHYDESSPDDPFSLCGYCFLRLLGWIAGDGDRKLLWLPPNWRGTETSKVRWNGIFLVFTDSRFPAPIIIAFQPQLPILSPRQIPSTPPES